MPRTLAIHGIAQANSSLSNSNIRSAPPNRELTFFAVITIRRPDEELPGLKARDD